MNAREIATLGGAALLGAGATLTFVAPPVATVADPSVAQPPRVMMELPECPKRSATVEAQCAAIAKKYGRLPPKGPCADQTTACVKKGK